MKTKKTDTKATAPEPDKAPAAVAPDDEPEVVNAAEEPEPEPEPDAEPRLDETIPGGRYMVNGMLVNAEGEEITRTGRVKHPAKE